MPICEPKLDISLLTLLRIYFQGNAIWKRLWNLTTVSVLWLIFILYLSRMCPQCSADTCRRSPDRDGGAPSTDRSGVHDFKRRQTTNANWVQLIRNILKQAINIANIRTHLVSILSYVHVANQTANLQSWAMSAGHSTPPRWRQQRQNETDAGVMWPISNECSSRNIVGKS